MKSKKQRKQIDWVCNDCGSKYGKWYQPGVTAPEIHCATYHLDTCCKSLFWVIMHMWFELFRVCLRFRTRLWGWRYRRWWRIFAPIGHDGSENDQPWCGMSWFLQRNARPERDNGSGMCCNVLRLLIAVYFLFSYKEYQCWDVHAARLDNHYRHSIWRLLARVGLVYGW